MADKHNTSPEAEDPRPRRSLKRFAFKLLRRLVLLAVVLLAVAVALYLLWVPGWARRRVVDELSTRLGRPVTVESVTTRLWSPHVTLHGVTIGAPEGDDRSGLLSIATLDVQAHPVAAALGGNPLGAVRLDHVKVAVVIDENGRWSFQDILDRLAAPKPPKPEKPEPEPEPSPAQPQAPSPPVLPSSVALRDLTVTLVDRRIDRELVMDLDHGTLLSGITAEGLLKLQWSLPRMKPAGYPRTELTLEGKAETTLAWVLQSLNGSIGLHAADLDLLHKWIDPHLLQDLSGLAADKPAVKLSMRYDPVETMLAVNGTVEADRIDTPEGVFHKVTFRIDRAAIDLARSQLALELALDLDDAHIRLRSDGPDTNPLRTIGRVHAAASLDIDSGGGATPHGAALSDATALLERPVASLQLNHIELKGGGANFSGSGLVVNLAAPATLGTVDGQRLVKSDTWGFVRLIAVKRDDALDDWLLKLSRQIFGELPDFAGGTRVVVEVNRGQPGTASDEMTLRAGLTAEGVTWQGNSLTGEVHGSVDAAWHRQDDRLRLTASLAGERLHLIGELPEDRIELTNLSIDSGMALTLHPLGRPGISVDLDRMWIRSDQLVQTAHGHLNRVPFELLQPDLASLGRALQYAGEIQLTVRTERLKSAPLLDQLVLPGLRELSTSARRAIDRAYADHPTLVEAVRHQLELQSLELHPTARNRILGDLGRVLRPTGAMPLHDLLDRLSPVGALRGELTVSKPAQSETVTVDQQVELAEVQLNYRDASGRLFPLHPQGLPWQLTQHLEIDSLGAGQHGLNVVARGSGHLQLASEGSAQIGWSGRLDTGAGTFEFSAFGRDFQALEEPARPWRLPVARGGFVVNAGRSVDAVSHLEVRFDKLAGRLGARELLGLDGALKVTASPDDRGRTDTALRFDRLVADSSTGPAVQLNGTLRLGDWELAPRRESLALTAEGFTVSSPDKPGSSMTGRVVLTRQAIDDGSRLSLGFAGLSIEPHGPKGPTVVEGTAALELGEAPDRQLPEARLVLSGFRLMRPRKHSAVELTGAVHARHNEILAQGLSIRLAGPDSENLLTLDAHARDVIRWDVLDQLAAGRPTEVMLPVTQAIGGDLDAVTRRLIDSVRVGDKPVVSLQLRSGSLDLRPIENRLGVAITQREPSPNRGLMSLMALRDRLENALPESTFRHLHDVVATGSAELLRRLDMQASLTAGRMIGHGRTARDVTLSARMTDGLMKVDRGRIEHDHGTVDLTGTTVSLTGCRLDLAHPLKALHTHPVNVFVSVTAEGIPASQPINEYVNFLFPGLSFAGTYSGRSRTSFSASPDVEQFEKNGRLSMDLKRYLASLNGSGHAIITDGLLRGGAGARTEADLGSVESALPKLDYRRYKFRSMRQDFFIVQGRQYNFMEFDGGAMNLWVHGVSRPDLSVRYVVGVDVNRNLRSSVPLSGARFPVMRYRGNISDGSFDGHIDVAPPRLLAYHILQTGLVDSVREGVFGLGYLQGLVRLVTLPFSAVQSLYDWAGPAEPIPAINPGEDSTGAASD